MFRSEFGGSFYILEGLAPHTAGGGRRVRTLLRFTVPHLTPTPSRNNTPYEPMCETALVLKSTHPIPTRTGKRQSRRKENWHKQERASEWP